MLTCVSGPTFTTRPRPLNVTSEPPVAVRAVLGESSVPSFFWIICGAVSAGAGLYFPLESARVTTHLFPGGGGGQTAVSVFENLERTPGLRRSASARALF